MGPSTQDCHLQQHQQQQDRTDQIKSDQLIKTRKVRAQLGSFFRRSLQTRTLTHGGVCGVGGRGDREDKGEKNNKPGYFSGLIIISITTSNSVIKRKEIVACVYVGLQLVCVAPRSS
ncbi:hypothetical protein ECG_07571 [Echinococcus granulosus]|uniref:Expressed protein n=1 Tax=Echinococcus granulosus TaxID=6210 RepID=A0A068WPJ6_ECHGR|nr:hypothetical protein ECG_07571 [Echinococcus granulosus]CDS20394.1 expressed protein [Echinococcus granulosus]